MAAHRVSVGLFRLLCDRLEVPAFGSRHQTERNQDRAEQDGVSERRRRRFELPPVSIEGGEAGPERVTLGAALNLRRHRIEQAMLGQGAKRQLCIPRTEDLVVLSIRRDADAVAIRPRWVVMASTMGRSRRKLRCDAITIARSIRTGSSWKRSFGSPIERIAVLQVLQAADIVDDRIRGDS